MLAALINSDEGEAANAAQEKGSDGAKGGERGALRWPHLEDHDRDDDGKHAVAEGFETVFGHRVASGALRFTGWHRREDDI